VHVVDCVAARTLSSSGASAAAAIFSCPIAHFATIFNALSDENLIPEETNQKHSFKKISLIMNILLLWKELARIRSAS
jgi:hypothetical protein